MAPVGFQILELLEASPPTGLGLPVNLWAPRSSSHGDADLDGYAYAAAEIRPKTAAVMAPTATGNVGSKADAGFGENQGQAPGNAAAAGAAGDRNSRQPAAWEGSSGHAAGMVVNAGAGAVGDGASRGVSATDLSGLDIRASRISDLGLAVELPEGAEGRVGLFWPESGAVECQGSCAQHPSASRNGSVVKGGDGEGGGLRGSSSSSSGVCWCTSLQEASLLAHLHAMQHAVAADATTAAGSADGSPKGDEFAAAWSLAALRETAAVLGQRLEAGRSFLERMLPVWRSHGFLIPDEV